MIQRLVITHAHGRPLEYQNLEFETIDGTRYRLTHYETLDAEIVWLHGFREADRVRHYTSRTPDECNHASLEWLRGGNKTAGAIGATSPAGPALPSRVRPASMREGQ